jgi:hypothetical protein
MDRQVIQVIGPARGQTRGLCVSNWYFDVPHSLPGNEGHKYMRDTQAILAGLLNPLPSRLLPTASLSLPAPLKPAGHARKRPRLGNGLKPSSATTKTRSGVGGSICPSAKARASPAWLPNRSLGRRRRDACSS